MKITKEDFAIVSRVGGRKENQDNAMVHKGSFGTLLIVCDGAGGYNGGRYASQFVCHYIIDKFRQYTSQIEIKDFLLKTISNANAELLEISSSDADKEGMKTTLALAFVKDTKALLFHVGDSRVYHIKWGKIAYITQDHSYVNELLLQNRITKKEAINHPKSNVITNAMGVPPSSLRIEVKDLNIGKKDLLLLTTDGCHGLIPQSKLESMIRKFRNLGQLCDKICDYCEVQGRLTKHGMYDNLTILAYSQEYQFYPFPIIKSIQAGSLALLFVFSSVFAYNSVFQNKTKVNNNLPVNTISSKDSTQPTSNQIGKKGDSRKANTIRTQSPTPELHNGAPKKSSNKNTSNSAGKIDQNQQKAHTEDKVISNNTELIQNKKDTSQQKSEVQTNKQQTDGKPQVQNLDSLNNKRNNLKKSNNEPEKQN